MGRYFVLIVLGLGFVQILFAQKKNSTFTLADEENAVFKNEWSLGMRMHTNGFSAYYERVWIKSIYKKRVLQTNFFYFKDFKQKKVKSAYAEVFNANGYFYGKQNNFWNLNVLYGQKKVLAEKADKNGVRVSMVYLGGISLGILKPYGLDIVEQDNFSEAPPERVVRFYDEDNPGTFLDPFNSDTRIYGPAGVGSGFNRIQAVPGIHGKFGFNFDWAGKENVVKSIELGAQVDIYYRNLPVMITSRNKPYVLNLYLAFQLGKRW
jgi:hypothetical protein